MRSTSGQLCLRLIAWVVLLPSTEQPQTMRMPHKKLNKAVDINGDIRCLHSKIHPWVARPHLPGDD